MPPGSLEAIAMPQLVQAIKLARSLDIGVLGYEEVKPVSMAAEALVEISTDTQTPSAHN
jgi:hypothetical protein